MKRNYFDLDLDILRFVCENEKTYTRISRGLSTGYTTVKNHCERLQKFNQVKIEEKESHRSNGKKYTEVKITDEGLKFLREHEKLNKGQGE